MQTSLYSLALVAAGLTPAWSQEVEWKPAGGHAARYQPPGEEPVSLLGKPVKLLGKPVRKVDQAVQPAQFGGAALPPAPPGLPSEYEALPFPKTMMTAAAVGLSPRQAGQEPPRPPVPGKGAAETIPGMPVPSGVMQGPLPPGMVVGDTVHQGPFIPGADGTFVSGPMGEGLEGWPGFAGERFFLSAPHGAPCRWYGSIDYLLYGISNDEAPALVTTGPQDSNGILGQPGVSVLFGGEIGDATLNGGRLTLGIWFNRCQTWGMIGSVFTTQRREDTFFTSSPGDPLLARPFFNAQTFLEDSELVAADGILSGSVAIHHASRLSGADLNFRFNLWNSISPSRRWHHHIDFYAGVRWMSLDESHSITENLLALEDSSAPGARFLVQDQFATHNDFIGANLGLLHEWRWKRFFVGTKLGVGIGATRQHVTINGSTAITPPGEATVVQPGGLLALPTNIGGYGRNKASVIGDFGLNLGLNVTDHLRLYVGYDLIYWTNVVRPGRQIDRSVNPSQLPTVDGPGELVGSPRPGFTFRDSNVLIHGLTAGLQWVY
jgi:hypothetical protein